MFAFVRLRGVSWYLGNAMNAVEPVCLLHEVATLSEASESWCYQLAESWRVSSSRWSEDHWLLGD